MAYSRFHNLLKEKVQAAIKDTEASITGGHAADYSEYKYWVGYARGLNDALRLCDDIEGDLNK
jgi:hypothetical protein